MAEGKKSFILYCDQKDVWDELSNEEAGMLIKHLFAYVSDEYPELEDKYVKIASLPIIKSLKRDLIKWEEKQIQRSEAGKKSAELRRLKAIEDERKATTVESRSTNPTVSGSVSVSVSDSVNGSVSEIKKEKSVKKIFTPPTLDQVLIYFKENNYNEATAKKAFNYYDIADWKDSRGTKIKNWKQKMQGVWFKDENKTGSQYKNQKQPNISVSDFSKVKPEDLLF